MAILTLKINGKTLNIPFSGTPLLADLLERQGISNVKHCGGEGKCGKCAVIASGCVSPESPAEIRAKTRLACQTRLFGDAFAEVLFPENEFAYIESRIGVIKGENVPRGYSAAVDIGTTTVVLKLFSEDCRVIAEASMLNPQRSVSSDVMGRINASLNGKRKLLQNQIVDCITDLLKNASNKADIPSESVGNLVITGNTAMLYFLCGLDVKSLSAYPFKSDNLFGMHIEQPFKAFIPPCMNAFVGGDVTCSVIASSMCESEKTALLCDIGTNGEIALWKNGVLYVTSAAAGPAFEGANVSCGCGYVNGAVDRIVVENGAIKIHTVNGGIPKGLCGSGLIDALAVFLKLGYIDESGNISSSLKIANDLYMTRDDIRALQLAKSAIFSGITVLLAETETSVDEIEAFYLSGGFGNNLSVESAANVGLFPKALLNKAKPIGNGALHGAALMLFNQTLAEKYKTVAENSQHILLGGNKIFNEEFIKNIQFFE